MQLLWNGELLDEFLPKHKVRQGSLISPYLFVFFLKSLTHLVNLVIHKKAWKSIKINKRGPLISHLAFVDDILLFAKATLNQVNVA
uniref:Reverse transcriptase domain-containing protein n=1 Tax=Cajanus cajan TaxID=3821 RepID=A0A151RH99_CAJCA|nr:hypothetical protein KK1_036768 [Cajanus cajan]